jgi:glutamate-1-semialdehyde 2,1-aminomutase
VDKIGALLIFDEVTTFRLGFQGRAGAVNCKFDPAASEIGGGFSVDAVGGHANVMAVFDPSHCKSARGRSGPKRQKILGEHLAKLIPTAQ